MLSFCGQFKRLTFVVSLLVFQFLRALWFALRERVSCLDELDMCTTRLRLQLPGEPATDDIHVIHPLQVQRFIPLTVVISFLSHFFLVETQAKSKKIFGFSPPTGRAVGGNLLPIFNELISNLTPSWNVDSHRNPLAFQLDQQRLKFTSDRIVAQTELRKKMGQLLYLNNLAKVQIYSP